MDLRDACLSALSREDAVGSASRSGEVTARELSDRRDRLKDARNNTGRTSNTILDRLIHNAHRIEMRGDSMRKNRGKPNG